MSDTLEKANEKITNLNKTNGKLQKRIDISEKEVLELCKQKEEECKKLMDETDLNKAKIKTIENSLKAKDKEVQNAKKELEIARNTIAKLGTEMSNYKTSETIHEAVEKNLDVKEEYSSNDYIKDENENDLESLSLKQESRIRQETSSMTLVQMSQVRKSSPTRTSSSPECTLPSPHTPPGPPPSFSSSQQQPLQATISCYFEESGPDLVHKSKLLTEGYVKNLSKLNLAPRLRRHEDA